MAKPAPTGRRRPPKSTVARTDIARDIGTDSKATRARSRRQRAGFTGHLRKVGGSLMVAIPPPLLDALHLGAESAVDLSLDAGRLVIRPIGRPRYTLDQLLARCDPSAPLPREDREWLDSPPIGRELI